MTETKTYRDLIPVIVEREKAVLPDGFDSWGIKSTRPDLTTRHGYRWPLPGGVAVAEDVNVVNDDPCPSLPGDGLCVAHTWRGMASGGFPARTLLLVATAEADRLSRPDPDKSRWSRVAVVALVDGEALVRAEGKGADLRRADLRGADLCGANLYGADLYGADLYGADLRGANLRGANLCGANLYGADLYGANLRGADLRGADLYGRNADDLRARGAIL